VVRHDAAREIGLLLADRGIVAVQLDAGPARRVDRGVINLDLVSLGIGAPEEQPRDPTASNISYRPRPAATQEDPTRSSTAVRRQLTRILPGQRVGLSKGESLYCEAASSRRTGFSTRSLNFSFPLITKLPDQSSIPDPLEDNGRRAAAGRRRRRRARRDGSVLGNGAMRACAL